ncbi:MAG: glycosyltransferase, partial [Eubacteriales bacterium]|nr:glycosyltransferase [Eubacteriales bacterium]
MADEQVKVLLTGGGTGGHIYPAIVIADEIRRLNPSAQILFVGTRRGLESKVVPRLGYEIKYIDVRFLVRRLTLKNFVTIYKALTSVFASKKIIREFKPDIVVGTGGYVSGPVVLAASMLKVPTLIHEQNAFPGLTTRLLSGRVTRVAVSHAAAVKRLKS